ncbi:MAG: hypothetical protein J6P66_05310 [Bacteroidaceae bacterium]|nr:hypothetical protein [Bacteroidaceae bacterium]
MKRTLILLAAFLVCLCAQAQFVSFPSFGRNLKMSSDPVLGLEGLHVGDEGYVTFEVTNTGDSIYTGPIYLRVVEREHSVQVLAAKKIKFKPGRSYSVTTVFPTDRLHPFARYYVAFEYNENGHTVPMGFTEAKPLESFMLLPEIINNPSRKAPVKSKVKEVKK